MSGTRRSCRRRRPPPSAGSAAWTRRWRRPPTASPGPGHRPPCRAPARARRRTARSRRGPRGWAVVALDRCADDPALSYPLATRADLDATVRSCAAPERVLGMVADVRDQEKLSAAVATAVRRFGRLDAAVGVAGVLSGGGPLWETTDEQLRTMLDVDIVGVYRLARAAVPALLSSPPPAPAGTR